MFGGPWADPEQFLHVQLPDDVDPDCIRVAIDYSISEDSEKKAVKNAQASILYTEALVERAMAFGQKIIKEFAAENIRLGITQDGKTAEVRVKMANVLSALSTGSLYDAIDQANEIEDFDAKYVTEARIQSFIAKIQTYLGQ